MDEVKRFVTGRGRPFSLQDLQMSCKISKSNAEKFVDKLVEEEFLRMKTYGKSKIYYENQVSGDSAVDIQSINRQLTDNEANLQENLKVLKQLEKSNPKGGLTLSEACEKKLDLDIQLNDVKKALADYNGVKLVDAEVV